MKIEEYVPATMPMIRARAKYFVASAPRKNSAVKTIRTVSEVFMERVMVWFKDFPTVSSNVSFLPAGEAGSEVGFVSLFSIIF